MRNKKEYWYSLQRYNWIVNNRVIVNGNVYDHKIINPLRRNYNFEINMQDGTIIKNYPGLQEDIILQRKDFTIDKTVGNYRKSIAALKRNVESYYAETGVLPVEEQLNTYLTGEFKQLSDSIKKYETEGFNGENSTTKTKEL
ncbi:hypothetical protein [Halalkalibacter sp. APA_J-10(15)]|uniref:hypothetical protein n=1 Tax=Halalkalibacter sp. APA_J-10(15) TaxID=2933805 RepID=UPI001FF56B06|nr:hypothetical protein [Halalkalibacter sp. APA_J-10(15)]MCK0470865.1 hypothetical protein [Halalkalibacter sp. APA_J-10(15)]